MNIGTLNISSVLAIVGALFYLFYHFIQFRDAAKKVQNLETAQNDIMNRLKDIEIPYGDTAKKVLDLEKAQNRIVNRLIAIETRLDMEKK